MYDMGYDIEIGNYRLGTLQSVEIHKSVDLLTQTAEIVLPAVVYNQSFDHEKYINVGDRVTIKIGYDSELREEYQGYVQRIDTDDDTLTINCEDSMFLTRKPVADMSFTKTDVVEIVQYCLSEIGFGKLNCTYNVTYDKFVISSANAFNVFCKLKEETKAQIYMVDEVLHIHPPYIQKGGEVIYDFAANIESSDLKYRNSDDRQFEVEVEGISLDGTRRSIFVGTTGGEKRKVVVANPTCDEELKRRGEIEMQYLSFSGYEGSIDGWLIPYVEPTWTAQIKDSDYEYKEGKYYVNAVTTTLSDSGGVRKVELGRKVS